MADYPVETRKEDYLPGGPSVKRDSQSIWRIILVWVLLEEYEEGSMLRGIWTQKPSKEGLKAIVGSKLADALLEDSFFTTDNEEYNLEEIEKEGEY